MDKTAELFAATARENLVALQALTARAQADTAKLVELNLATSNSLMAQSFEYAKAMTAAKDPQSLASLQASLAKPMGEIAAAYMQEFQKIVAGSGTEFAKLAQTSMVDMQKSVTAMMGSATKNAPSGAGPALDFFNQALVASQNAFKSAQASAQQMIDTASKTANKAAKTT